MKIKQKLKYHFENFLSKGTLSLILMLFLITFISVVIVGVIAYFVSGGNNVLHVIWVSFMQTLDAGNLSDEEGRFSYVFLMTVSTIVGIFVTSLLISFISNGFQNKLENMQKGTSQIIEKNHTIILGYNENVKVIVKELIEANRNMKHPVIAILSERDMMDTLTDLKQTLKTFHNSKVIVRTGSIYDKSNLEMMSIAEAKSVIIVEKCDSDTIKAILAISQTPFFKAGHSGYISTILSHEKNISVAKSIGGDKLEVIHLSDAMNRIMSQTCLQPGLSFVYKDLFDFTGDEFYFYNHHKKLTNYAFSEILNLFHHSTVVGLFRNQKVLINPPMDIVVNDDDQIIVISEDDDTIFIDYHPDELNLVHFEDTVHYESRMKRGILSIGYNDSTLSVIQGMEPYMKKGTCITFLMDRDVEDSFQDALSKIESLEYHITKGITYDRDILESVDYQHVNTIIVFANQAEDDEQSDSETLLTVLHLREIEKRRNLDFQIVIEIKKNTNADSMQYASIDDFVVSNILSNKMLSQISENRYLNQLFQELLTSEGSEIYLKPARQYTTLDTPIRYENIVISASHKSEIAIGYKLKALHSAGGVVLNPEKDSIQSFHEGDCIIVLAED